MNPSDKLSRRISERSYENLRKNKYYDILGKDYKVIEKRDDTQNGFRAYVFAPVIKGKVDKSQLLIGYAGTNPYSLNDIRTDLQLPIHHNTNNLKINNHYKDLNNSTIHKKYNTINDKNDLFSFSSVLYTKALIGDRTPAKFAPTQMDESDAFTESVKKKYPDSEIHPLGHSLGAFLAQYNLIKHNLDNGTTYAAPNVYHSFTGDFKKDIDNGVYDSKIRNIGHFDDPINKLNFFNPRIGKNITAMPHYDGFITALPLIGQHTIESYNDFDADGNVKEMPELEQFNDDPSLTNRFQLFDPFGINSRFFDSIKIDSSILNRTSENDFDPFAILNKKDKLFESNDFDIEGFNNKQKEDLSIDLNPFDDDDPLIPKRDDRKKLKAEKESSVKKGKGGSKDSGKKVKIQPDEVRNIANTIRDRLFLYTQIITALDEYREETISGGNRILDKYQSELLSGPHEFITPYDLEQYMEILAVEGSLGNFKFYNNGLMDDLIQELDQNKKDLLQFAEKLEFAANKFEEKDLEESDVFGLFS
ncbi:lipase [Staphylococcus argenteus]|uniref:lipase n=2 Tax=Staphylococcus argenteus TaxID=985002 RepID=UPI000913323E|nr:lipase [Staphylococcus argenteus]MCG9855223.1 lipase [Staphylococcus argenteus]MDR7650779.1 lipase [Staphylococcus argenteus]MDR7683643.1 lipase [Staphylococcus argenteus]SGX33199.1 pathogenicity island protein [Staphylococcus argenteus]SGX63763.1 pathogenicity island protein [Staphylococcus argenteus]